MNLKEKKPGILKDSSAFLNRCMDSLTVVVAVILVPMMLLGIICFNSVKVNAQASEYVKNDLSAQQSKGLVKVDEGASLPGVNEARTVVVKVEEKKKAIALKKQQKWLKAQEKRVAAAKKKKDAKSEKTRREKEAEANSKKTYKGSWNGLPLTRGRGTIMGPSGKETYYNLDMSTCVSIMRGMGFSARKYPYAVRADGVKTLGGYVMVAANLRIRPKGSFIKTSLGTGIVVDTGGFAAHNPTQLDIATNW